MGFVRPIQEIGNNLFCATVFISSKIRAPVHHTMATLTALLQLVGQLTALQAKCGLRTDSLKLGLGDDLAKLPQAMLEEQCRLVRGMVCTAEAAYNKLMTDSGTKQKRQLAPNDQPRKHFKSVRVGDDDVQEAPSSEGTVEVITVPKQMMQQPLPLLMDQLVLLPLLLLDNF